MVESTDPYQWQGRTIFSSDGEKIGKISEIYEDRATGRPEWASVTSGLFQTRSNFVPLTGAAEAGEDVRAQVTRDQVRDAPEVENDDELSEAEERRLFEHYGIPFDTSRGATLSNGRGAGRERSPRGDAGPHSGDQGPGRARLRRYVVTERVIMEVPAPDEKRRGDPLHGAAAGEQPQPGIEDDPRRRGR